MKVWVTAGATAGARTVQCRLPTSCNSIFNAPGIDFRTIFNAPVLGFRILGVGLLYYSNST